jgi:phosphate-selective porin
MSRAKATSSRLQVAMIGDKKFSMFRSCSSMPYTRTSSLSSTGRFGQEWDIVGTIGDGDGDECDMSRLQGVLAPADEGDVVTCVVPKAGRELTRGHEVAKCSLLSW